MSDQPLLPPEPWYKSEVQVRAVIAIVFQVVSVVLRMVGRYTEVTVTSEQLDLLAADISQLAAFLFAGLAIMKRQTSTVQPLTLTARAAEVRRAETPPVHSTDPTKQAGIVRAAMLGLLLVISVPSVLMLQGCETFGTRTPQTFNERLASGYTTVTGIRNAAIVLVEAKEITADDAQNVQNQADNLRSGLDIARAVSDTDMSAADAKLQATITALTALEAYLQGKGKS